MNTLSSETLRPGFVLPANAIARHPDVILAPRALRRWLEELPLANPPKAAQLLRQQLDMLVRDPNPGTRLPALLQLYTPTLRSLFEFAQARMQNGAESAVPLDQLEYVLLEILSAMARGHLRVANDAIAAGKAPPVDHLYHALRLLDEAQTIEWVHYHRPDDQIWRLQLQIFRLAEFHQLDNEAVGFADKPADHPDSIRQLFFRSLVTSLTDPHHHRASDTLAWHAWVGQHADLLELAVLPDGPFAIPLDVSGSRRPLDSARRAKPGTDTRYLTTERFLQVLRDDDLAPQGLYDVLTGLINGRMTADQRREPRQQRNHPYRLWNGLSCIHQRLSALIQGDDPDRGPAAGAVNCTQINHSRSGAAFHMDAHTPSPLAIDEPVLVEAATSDVGVAAVGFTGGIKRLVNDGNRVEIGVAKFDGRLIPVKITGPAAERSRGNPQALLLQHQQGSRLTLLASSRVFREGEIIVAENHNSRHSLKMRRLSTLVKQIAYIEVESVTSQ